MVSSKFAPVLLALRLQNVVCGCLPDKRLETQQASRGYFLSYQLNPNLSLGRFLSTQVYFVRLSRDNKFTDFERIFICF